ncbi:MAG: TonB-dependent receptor [Gammaproteobacteria bacterium]
MSGKPTMNPVQWFCAFIVLFSFNLDAAVLEEVVVTAQKREQSLQDVSAAVSAVGMDRLQAGNIDNIEDLQRIVPSITLGNDFNMAKLFIRGVGANTSTTGSQPGVAMHVDGAYVARAEAQLTSLFDLERVEVLRGPQGSLYGRNAVGGSINLITAKPTEEFEGYGRVTVGDYQMINTEGAVSGPITDRILGRIAFKTEGRGGYGVNPVTGNEVDDLSRRMFRSELQINFTDDIDLLATGEYYVQDDASRALKFRARAFPGVARLASPGVGGFASRRRDLAAEVDPATYTETWSVTGIINWRLNDNITLTSITNYRDFDAFLTQDLDISAIVNSLATTGFNTTVQRRDVESQQESEEIQFKFRNDWLNAVTGFFYFNEDQQPVDTVGLGAVIGQPQTVTTLTTLATLPPFPPIGPTSLELDGTFVPGVAIDPNLALDLCNTFQHVNSGIVGQTPLAPKRVCIESALSSEVFALFGQFTINLGRFFDGLDGVSLKLGGRYSHEEVTSANPSIIIARNGQGPVIQTTTAGSFNKRTFRDFTPEIGMEWRATDNLLLYYTYSEGFKAGAGENAVPNPVTTPLSAIVSPEEIQNNEFGLRSTWFDDRLAVNIAGYFYDSQGQQINKTQAGGPAGFTTIFQNVKSTSAKGVEVEFFAEVTDWLRLSGSTAYNDAQYDNFLTNDPLNPKNIQTPGPPGFLLGDPTGFNPAEPQVQLAGNPLRNSPRWSANLHGEIDIPGLALPYAGHLTLMGDASAKDAVFFTEFNRSIEGSAPYLLGDLNLRYSSGNDKLTADFWVKNIGDVIRASSTFQLATARTIGVTYLPPRTYGFTLGYKF